VLAASLKFVVRGVSVIIIIVVVVVVVVVVEVVCRTLPKGVLGSYRWYCQCG